MAEFHIAFERTMRFEGGYVFDPDDRGGETFRGISRRSWPDWPGWTIIDRFKSKSDFRRLVERNSELEKMVATFYQSEFWNQIHGDEIPDQSLADELFDCSINLGIKQAVTFFQKGLNILKRADARYSEIAEDGLFGPATFSALRAYLVHDQPRYLLKVMVILRGMHYIKILTKDPSQRKFARGWLERVRMS